MTNRAHKHDKRARAQRLAQTKLNEQPFLSYPSEHCIDTSPSELADFSRIHSTWHCKTSLFYGISSVGINQCDTHHVSYEGIHTPLGNATVERSNMSDFR